MSERLERLLMALVNDPRMRTSVHAQRRRLMSQGMTETEARQWVEALGFKVGTEPWEDA